MGWAVAVRARLRRGGGGGGGGGSALASDRRAGTGLDRAAACGDDSIRFDWIRLAAGESSAWSPRCHCSDVVCGVVCDSAAVQCGE